MIRLIGLAGEARCGKSSAAGFLKECLGFEQYALASPIKMLINTLFGWDEKHSEGSLKETVVEVGVNPQAFFEVWNDLRMDELVPIEMSRAEYVKMIELLFQDETANDGPFISPRRAYQLFGTDYGRGLNPTIWLDVAKRKLDELPEDSGLIITDVRFPNEHKWISRNGGFLVHVRRNGSGHIIGGPEHESEAGLKRMSMDWVTPFCEDLIQLEDNCKRVAQFAQYAQTADVRLSGRMPSFEQVYGDKANG